MNRDTVNNIVFVLIGLAGAGGLAAILSHSGQQVANQRAAGGLAKTLGDVHQRQNFEEIRLQARFDNLGLPGCLSPASLVSTAQVHQCEAGVVTLHTLLVERDQAATAEYAQDRAVLDGLPAGPVRDEALRRMSASIERMRLARADLTKAELANAEAVQAVLGWADRNHAMLHVDGGSLLVGGRRQLEELGALRDALKATVQGARAALVRANQVVAESNESQLTVVREFNAMY